jgi:hypothetical protein
MVLGAISDRESHPCHPANVPKTGQNRHPDLTNVNCAENGIVQGQSARNGIMQLSLSATPADDGKCKVQGGLAFAESHYAKSGSGLAFGDSHYAKWLRA